MDKQSKVVDLEMSSDGSYSPKRAKNNIPTKHKKFIEHGKNYKNPKYIMRNDADDFLGGIDAGLDFIESVVPRINRFLGLRY